MQGVFQERNSSRPAEAEETRAFLAAIVESSDDSIIGTDLEGCILSWNGGAERLFGYASVEIVGRHINIIFPSDQPAAYRPALERVRREERIERFESVRVRKDGDLIDVSVILSPVKDSSGRLRGVSAIYRDITQRKSAQLQLLQAKEAAEAASRAKSAFLANMSHEIRTPMNGILGMTEVLLESSANVEQQEQLSIIKNCAECLLAIINDILDFSKIEAEKLALEREPFALRPAVERTVREMLVLAGRKGLRLAHAIHAAVPENIVGDVGRLRQILVNLIGNAIKFTESGAIAVTIRMLPGDLPQLWFSVADTGVGIPASKQEMIFDAFTQADSSHTRKFGGTGLGLAITARLVKMMGGRIWVESDGLSGSTFHFTLPRQ